MRDNMRRAGGNRGANPADKDQTVRLELEYQVARVSHHSSIVLFDGCNECGGGGGADGYDGFVMTTVASVDQSRLVYSTLQPVLYLATLHSTLQPCTLPCNPAFYLASVDQSRLVSFGTTGPASLARIQYTTTKIVTGGVHMCGAQACVAFIPRIGLAVRRRPPHNTSEWQAVVSGSRPWFSAPWPVPAPAGGARAVQRIGWWARRAPRGRGAHPSRSQGADV